MNAEQVCAKLSKAIQAVEAWHDARLMYPKEAEAAEEMFLKCYPKRKSLITGIRRS